MSVCNQRASPMQGGQHVLASHMHQASTRITQTGCLRVLRTPWHVTALPAEPKARVLHVRCRGRLRRSCAVTTGMLGAPFKHFMQGTPCLAGQLMGRSSYGARDSKFAAQMHELQKSGPSDSRCAHVTPTRECCYATAKVGNIEQCTCCSPATARPVAHHRRPVNHHAWWIKAGCCTSREDATSGSCRRTRQATQQTTGRTRRAPPAIQPTAVLCRAERALLAASLVWPACVTYSTCQLVLL